MTRLLINESPLMILPTLAKHIGLNEAIILQQIHYWLDARINNNIRRDVRWVYNSYSKWLEQFPFWSEKTIKRIITNKINLLGTSVKMEFGILKKDSLKSP